MRKKAEPYLVNPPVRNPFEIMTHPKRKVLVPVTKKGRFTKGKNVTPYTTKPKKKQHAKKLSDTKGYSLLRKTLKKIAKRKATKKVVKKAVKKTAKKVMRKVAKKIVKRK